MDFEFGWSLFFVRTERHIPCFTLELLSAVFESRLTGCDLPLSRDPYHQID